MIATITSTDPVTTIQQRLAGLSDNQVERSIAANLTASIHLARREASTMRPDLVAGVRTDFPQRTHIGADSGGHRNTSLSSSAQAGRRGGRCRRGGRRGLSRLNTYPTRGRPSRQMADVIQDAVLPGQNIQ
ncbi:hypothetical protein [Nocardia iowensis]|uniref:Uncharacterized protein n=1 Tax=Nocardia iowensis TaxID=204891 RepID=A0ABX8RMY0_NOCIO|nr:hypothetical protein [Nocardia iowensis]QXN90244.1 hypothetical protein KV110_33260 [Nocardia iowensis]